MAIVAVAVAFQASAVPALAASAAETAKAEATYDRCMAKARSDAKAAYDDAVAWQKLGGGLPARHCAAVALVGMREYAEAAARLESLFGDAPEADVGLRLGLLGQAAQAWQLSGRAERAEQLQDQAIAISPDDRQLRIDRAATRLTRGKSWEAVDDLNIAIDLDPRDPEALLYRASAYRYLDAVDLARDDVRRAIQLDPRRPEAWLERGILERLAGDKAAARKSWMEVIRLQPDGPAAEAARGRIEEMDVKRR